MSGLKTIVSPVLRHKDTAKFSYRGVSLPPIATADKAKFIALNLRPVGAIKGAIVDCFGNMSGFDFVGIFEVGDGARDF